MGQSLYDPRRLVQLAALAGFAVLLAGALPALAPAPADPAPAVRSAAPAASVPTPGRDSLVRPAAAAPVAPAEPEEPVAFEVVRVREGATVALRGRPRGRVVARLDAVTEFGSPQTLGVVKRRGGWLGVATSVLPNGRLGWLRAGDDAVEMTRTGISLTLDLSRRKLVLKHGDRVIRRMTVGIGRASSPTPTGRFAVTDKLAGSRYGPYYGCCIVALSAHQPRLPAGWPGGDRIAIHGTNQPSSIGVPSSAGCPHASEADMRVLMRRVPLGAPVFVRA